MVETWQIKMIDHWVSEVNILIHPCWKKKGRPNIKLSCTDLYENHRKLSWKNSKNFGSHGKIDQNRVKVALWLPVPAPELMRWTCCMSKHKKTLDKVLTNEQINLLGKGLKFILMWSVTNETQIRKQRTLAWIWPVCKKNATSVHLSRSKHRTSPFQIGSTWNPPVHVSCVGLSFFIYTGF